MPGIHQSKRKQVLVCSSHRGWVFTVVGRMQTSSRSRHLHEGWSCFRSSTNLPIHDTSATAIANSHPSDISPEGSVVVTVFPLKVGNRSSERRAAEFLLFLPAQPGLWEPAWVQCGESTQFLQEQGVLSKGFQESSHVDDLRDPVGTLWGDMRENHRWAEQFQMDTMNEQREDTPLLAPKGCHC